MMSSQGSEEGTLGALFLVCRLATLRRSLEALEPLRELAEQEKIRRTDAKGAGNASGSVQRGRESTQTERYLKRYIEIFREQSFAIISMYKSIFPQSLPAPGAAIAKETGLKSPTMPTSTGVQSNELPEVAPSALATFAPALIDMLFDVLREYLPTVMERASRDSLLTQVLYCAGSLGRLGADFGMILSLLQDELQDQETSDTDEPPEWVQVTKKHRVQASRLELLASGVGTGTPGGRKGSAIGIDLRSPSAVS